MPTAIQQLPAHLETRYGVQVAKLTPLEPWAPDGVQRVDRRDGPPWVARVFDGSRPLEAVEGDAQILRFLQEQEYPAERLAHEEPVSTFGGNSVLVTDLVEGNNLRGDESGGTVHAVGDLLGRLHTLPVPAGPVSREAGGWHHLSVAGGGRRADVDALLPLMRKAAQNLPTDQRAASDALCAELDAIDGCTDLPSALVNVDFGGPNIMRTPDGRLVTIDWTGAGRGPRVLSMTTLTLGARDPRLVDAFVAGYRRHASLETEELDRLTGALVVHSLVLDCWAFAFRAAPPEKLLQQSKWRRAAYERVAERAREAFTKPLAALDGWRDVAPTPRS